MAGYRRKTIQLIIIWIAVLAVLIVPRILEEPTSRVECKLLYVVDGDTICVIYNQETVLVRLIGIDAPESVHPKEEQNTQFGETAAVYTEKLLSGRECVYLEFDEEKYDSYNRLLAYVYLEQDCVFEESINFCLVTDGYAINKAYPPNTTYSRVLEAACEDARKLRKGLWEKEGLSN